MEAILQLCSFLHKSVTLQPMLTIIDPASEKQKNKTKKADDAKVPCLSFLCALHTPLLKWKACLFLNGGEIN